MIKHKEQRVGVFVDVANMYHSAKNLYNARVNFREVLKTAVAGRKLIRAIAYVIKSETLGLPSGKTGEKNFFEALSKQGFEINAKDLQVFITGVKKADWDVGITIDAVKLADRLDSIILVTGDGDFQPLISYLKENKGCQVEVMAFGKTTSSKLLEIADDFVDLCQAPSKYLIKIK